MYTVTKEFISDRFLVATTSEKPISGMTTNKIDQANNSKYMTIITPNDAKYLLVYLTMNIKESDFGKANINKSANTIK